MKKAIFFVLCCVVLNAEANEKWSEFSAILKPSSIKGAGVGVFATHDIKKGARLFTNESTPKKIKRDTIPTAFLGFVVDIDDTYSWGPESFDRMGVEWYVNHSLKPNLVVDASGNCIAARDIKAGEELLTDYNRFNEPEELKDPYYK